MRLLMIAFVILTLIVPQPFLFSSQVLAPPAQIQSAQPTQNLKAEVLSQIFTHLNGIGILPVMVPLIEEGFFELYNPSSGYLSLEQIMEGMKRRWKAEKVKGSSKKFKQINPGYMRVALRLLVSHGWLNQKTVGEETVVYNLTDEGHKAVYSLYVDYWFYLNRVLRYLPHLESADQLLFGESAEIDVDQFEELVRFSTHQWEKLTNEGPPKLFDLEETEQLFRKYLDGLLAGPVMVALARRGVFEKGAILDLSQLGGNQRALSLAFELLTTQGWVIRNGNVIHLTDKGIFAGQIAHAYGVPVSYLPTFCLIPKFLFGDPERILRRDAQGNELLVDRPMNVWACGKAHQRYFKKMKEMVIDIFNRPLDEQPQGICDMGCGNGTLLKELYEVIKNETLRGQNFGIYPLYLVGTDFNGQAREATQKTLQDIPNVFVVKGDIEKPQKLEAAFIAKDLEMRDFLHVRSFLDHNRPEGRPKDYTPGTREASTSGAFSYRGEEIFQDALEENLVQSLKTWAPYVEKHGLLVLELHTLLPQLIAANLGKTLAIPYDATHGFSDQYLVEIEVWLKAAKEVGWLPKNFSKFPDDGLATISLAYFVSLAKKYQIDIKSGKKSFDPWNLGGGVFMPLWPFEKIETAI